MVQDSSRQQEINLLSVVYFNSCSKVSLFSNLLLIEGDSAI